MKLLCGGMLGAVHFLYRCPFQDSGSVQYTHVRTLLCIHVTLTNETEFTEMNMIQKNMV